MITLHLANLYDNYDVISACISKDAFTQEPDESGKANLYRMDSCS